MAHGVIVLFGSGERSKRGRGGKDARGITIGREDLGIDFPLAEEPARGFNLGRCGIAIRFWPSGSTGHQSPCVAGCA